MVLNLSQKLIIYVFLVLIVLYLPATLSAGATDEEEILIDFLWPLYLSLPAAEKPKVALVLGGGGARGLAHAGVVKVFAEEHLPVDIIVGTSVGALIGSLYAAGLPADTIVDMAQHMNWNKLVSFKLSPVGLYSTKRMEEYVTKYIGNKQFDELNIPFACVAVDIRNGEKIILKEGPVAPAVRASATMPGLFQPVEYRHRLLMDGGVIDNMPADVAKLMGADIIIAIDVTAQVGIAKTNNALLILSQVIYIRGNFLAEGQLKLADLVISPEVKDITVSELNRGEECVDAGVVATRAKVRMIKKVILNRVWDKL
ncbi:MAG: patatin-like phospholipase family protein [Elusimicrobia bacterium]|nr:patatin-like phospholipase family protein [Elusimicrobiota bacterium]